MLKQKAPLYAAILALSLFTAGCASKTTAPAAGSAGAEITSEGTGEMTDPAGIKDDGSGAAGTRDSGSGEKTAVTKNDGSDGSRAGIKDDDSAESRAGIKDDGSAESRAGTENDGSGGSRAGTENTAPEAGRAVPENEKASPMNPVYANAIKEGVYSIKADSSSSMFRVTECELTVKDGTMSAVMTMSGTGYLKVFMGTGEEAQKADTKDYIPYVETDNGTHTFKIPVDALDKGIDCSAFSKNKEKWYDRVLVFRSDSLPSGALADTFPSTVESLMLEDGRYTIEVRLEGGSGRASVESPAILRVENGKAFATITWGSSNYDYMKVDGEKFDVIRNGGNSSFEIPVSGFDWRMPVIADTIAMSEPHEIDYILRFDSSTLKKVK